MEQNTIRKTNHRYPMKDSVIKSLQKSLKILYNCKRFIESKLQTDLLPSDKLYLERELFNTNLLIRMIIVGLKITDIPFTYTLNDKFGISYDRFRSALKNIDFKFTRMEIQSIINLTSLTKEEGE